MIVSSNASNRGWGWRTAFQLATTSSIVVLASACSTLPSSGPTARGLLNGEKEQAEALDIRIEELSASTILPNTSGALRSTADLEKLARPGRVDLLGAGDGLDIEIFEVGVALFGTGGTADGFAPSARAQHLAVTVDGDGDIRLPYIGSVRVLGMTTAEVQQQIVNRLSGKSQAPQALVTLRESVTNSVLLSGAIGRPGRQVLTVGGDRLLDAIAKAGGLRDGVLPQSAVVRFYRNGQSAQVYLDAITPGSPADLMLLPRDHIDIVQRERTLTVFGAAPRVSEVRFETAEVTLAEAIARAGGPDQNAADPSAVFVFRYLDDPQAAQPEGAVGEANTAERPMIYRLNLLRPSSYFLAQRFLMRDKDVIYIANARSSQTRRLVEIVNLLFSPLSNARGLSR
jgi:polysaccharide export outer membrane protein